MKLQPPQDEKVAFILSLFDHSMVQFGSFTLKSGKKSPVYVDLRLLASYPSVMSDMGLLAAEHLRGVKYDRLAAIPLAGLPIGTALAFSTNKPMLYPRPPKDHGTKKRIEGLFEAGERVLLVDDVLSTGSSKLEAVEPLREAGLIVEDMFVIVERGMGGQAQMEAAGFTVHALTTLPDMLDVLRQAERISSEQHTEVNDWLAQERGG